MLRPSASRKRLLGLALALSVGTGAGVGAASIWSASGATTPQAHLADATLPAPAGGRDLPAETSGTGGSTAPAPASSPLTLEEAMAVATETAPGRVVEWDEDQELTGLRYDVTVLHEDRTTTEVEVDTVTGQVTSIDHDDDRWG